MSITLHIPRLKDELILAKDWTFTLHAEDRNLDLIGRDFGKEPPATIWGIDYIPTYRKFTPAEREFVTFLRDYPKPYTIVAGTVLAVERIYIRKGARDFDSVTFKVVHSPDEKLLNRKPLKFGRLGARFWAPLDDVNKMEIQDPGKALKA